MRRLRLPLICAAVGLGCALLAAGGLIVLDEPEAMVVIHSEPERATVFSDTRALGFTPHTLRLRRGERHNLRLVRAGRHEVEIALSADDYVAATTWERFRQRARGVSHSVRVALPSSEDAGLSITTAPDGVEVFLDGRRMGMTPLTLSGLEPGTRTLRLAHAECFPVHETISLVAGRTLTIEHALEFKVVRFYRDLIRKDPADLVQYAELAHHHVLRGEFIAAAEVLREGFAVAEKPGAKNIMPFLREIMQIYTRYFVYPPERPDAAVRPVCRELMQKADEKRLYTPKGIEGFLRQMNQYDAAHPGQ